MTHKFTLFLVSIGALRRNLLLNEDVGRFIYIDID